MRVRKMTALMLAGAMTASMGTFAFADEAKELQQSIQLSLVRITQI